MLRFLRLAILLALAALALAWTAIILVPATLYYPRVHVDAPGGLVIDVLAPGSTTAGQCASRLSVLARPFAAPAVAAAGFVARSDCRLGLSGLETAMLAGDPLQLPSTLAPDGTVLAYGAPDIRAALELCRQAEAASAGAGAGRVATCFVPGTARQLGAGH